MSDQEMKEKLERLDTLGGGIVFGRDEAWEKLQLRLDKKQNRKPFWYRVAAVAAMLLALLTFVYRYSDTGTVKQVSVVQIEPKAAQPVYTPEPEQSAPATVAMPASAVEHLSLSVRAGELPRTKAAVAPVAPVVVIDEDSELEASAQNSVESITEEAAVAFDISQLPVVHINDLERGIVPARTARVVQKGPSLNLNSMRVVSLYDVQREEMMRQQEEEIMTLVRINRPHDGFFSFGSALARGDRNNARLYARNPFSIRLNRSN